MPRYPRYRRRYRRRSGPAYTVTRKLIKAGAFSRLADSQYYAASAKLCLNPSNLTSDRVGSIVTVKHIEVQLAKPSDLFRRQWRSANKRVWSVRWRLDMCVCPWGNLPNKPFPDWGTGQIAYALQGT